MLERPRFLRLALKILQSACNGALAWRFDRQHVVAIIYGIENLLFLLNVQLDCAISGSGQHSVAATGNV